MLRYRDNTNVPFVYGLKVLGDIRCSQDIYCRNLYASGGIIIPGLTPGSVVFAGSDGSLSQDNSHLFYNSASARLGVGTNSPATTLHIVGATTLAGNTGVTGTLSVSSDFAVNTNKFTVAGLTGNAVIAGTLGLASDFAVNTNKFTIAGLTGNTVIAGTLGVTGNTTVTGTFGVTSDFSVNTNKFTIAGLTGNTIVAGTLGLTGNFAVNTNKFTIAGLTGNTVIAGTLGVTSDFAVNSNKATITATTGDTSLAGTLLVGNTAVFSSDVNISGVVNIGSGKIIASPTNGNTSTLGTLAVGSSSTTLAQLYVLNVGVGDSFRIDDQASDTTVFRVDNVGNVVIGTDVSVNYPTAKLALDSASQGFLPPRMAQSDKLNITSPTEGLMVYDSTSKVPSTFNGTNWYVKSSCSFVASLDTSPSTILWNTVTITADNRITYASGTGKFTITDAGLYQVSCSATFQAASSGEVPERSIVIAFINDGDSSTIASGATSLAALLETSTTAAFASMNCLLTATAGMVVRFTFSSSADNTIELNSRTHGYITRIT